MTTATKKYSLDDFESISGKGFKIELSEEFVNNVEFMCSELSVPFEFKKYHKDNIFERRKDLVFEPKKIEKKEGIEASITNIRTTLNKLTGQNYNQLCPLLLDLLDSLLVNNETSEDIFKINQFIFEFACANKFNSVVYARFYKQLVERYIILDGLIDKEIVIFLENFKEIKSCKASEDYVEFCRLNKINEKRKALSAFIVELVNNKSLSNSYIINLIVDLQNKLQSNLSKEDQSNTCEEIGENLYILYKCNYIKDIESDLLNKLKNEINTIITYDSKEYISFSKKLKFKLMDIKDVIKKYN
jgi:hypothetical protein